MRFRLQRIFADINAVLCMQAFWFLFCGCRGDISDGVSNQLLISNHALSVQPVTDSKTVGGEPDSSAVVCFHFALISNGQRIGRNQCATADIISALESDLFLVDRNNNTFEPTIVYEVPNIGSPNKARELMVAFDKIVPGNADLILRVGCAEQEEYRLKVIIPEEKDV